MQWRNWKGIRCLAPMGPQTVRAAGICWAGTGEILETMLRFGALCNGKMEPNDTKHIHTMDVHRTDTQVPTRVPQKPPCITTHCPGRAHRRSG